jgi:hypothetical protein
MWAYGLSVLDLGIQLELGNRDRAKFLRADIA